MNRLSKDKFERIEVGGWDVSRMWLSKSHSNYSVLYFNGLFNFLKNTRVGKEGNH